MTQPLDSTAVRARLLELRRETERLLAALTGSYVDIVDASESSNADDEHDPEGATIAFERSQVGAFLAQARAKLAEHDAADQRLAEGRYGVCERCNHAIPAERLEVRPLARTCIACADRRSASIGE
jgi:RNA polymerase-binding transcription factor DksA